MKYPNRVFSFCALFLILLSSSCGGGNSLRYKAEKNLFRARKMNDELSSMSANPEFLDRTLKEYRKIVTDYGTNAAQIDGMEMIVVSAQMELAELEFRAGRLEAAREDFKTAYTLAENISEARANALWSAGFISREIGDLPAALELQENFVREFLTPDKAASTGLMDSRYLLTPIRLAETSSASGAGDDATRWYAEAEKIYRHIISSEDDESLLRASRFNLVTTFLQRKEWKEALERVRELEKIYDTEADLPSLLLLEARIEQEGLKDPSRALSLLKRINDDYPGSDEAPKALITAAGIYASRREYDKAEKLYKEILEKHEEQGGAVIEAYWQLAQLAEIRNNWLEASLNYKAIYTNYPTTVQGMESPLKIANHFRDAGEKDAAAGAYQQAVDLYEKLISNQYPPSVRIMAEEYRVRAYTEQKMWARAAELLVELPDKYPDYTGFMQNYLMAASIYENEMGDAVRASRILLLCIDKYPGTGLAAEAEKQLARIKDSK